ncbi:UDP-N-acetylmuramoyl-tripeptide--D-alanyl-D-alanine ligase [Vagococcus sp.]|uniref:UDP-N-acetylmuramoyl-tripeptide--D-alanyl-D- alanine ligase n=1 Tax=Vagococcus sp. TaxID=1933889 RepID=UPI002FCC5264
MKLTVKEVVQAVKGKLLGALSPDTEIFHVEFDTRNVQSGTLFVPLKGNRDGHEFIKQAFERGAVVTFSDHLLETDTPYILVEDTLKAFQELASFYLNKLKPKVCAVTGSNGKTTTKDMIAAVLGTKYITYKTQGNYNNEIGLPYTIMSIDESVEMLVLEMGMDRKGDIELLTKIGNPDVAAITMIGESHIEHLGSREGIAAAKMEIVQGIKPNGILIVPANEPLLKPLIKEVKQTVETFGLTEGADLSATILEERKDQTSFTTNQFKDMVFTIPVLGQYNVSNALVALSVGNAFGVPVEKMVKGLATFDMTKNRTEWLETKDGIHILSDVYNANPTAMKLVLDSFSKLEKTGKKIVVLGDMLELGEESKEMHASVSEYIKKDEIDDVFLYGKQMESLYEVLKNSFDSSKLHFFEATKKEVLMKAVSDKIESGDTVFLKASNGMGLKEVVDYLLNNH